MPSKSKSELSADTKVVYETVDKVNSQIETLETFIARRFDEISMEINASAQQFDMAEDGITSRFSEVLEILGAINYSGGGETAANTGVELEAVIADTQQAADKILDAADNIIDAVDEKHDWDDKATRDEKRIAIQQNIQEVLMACTFQDLAGQRIQNTLDNLQNIEDRLNTTFEKLGIEVEPNEDSIADKTEKGSSQTDIDSLFD